MIFLEQMFSVLQLLKNLFLSEWKSNISLHCTHLYLSHIFFIHSSVAGPSGCIHVLANVNSAVINIRVHVSF